MPHSSMVAGSSQAAIEPRDVVATRTYVVLTHTSIVNLYG
jgi:hypothetical protein